VSTDNDAPPASITIQDATTEELVETLECLDTMAGLCALKAGALPEVLLVRAWIHGELTKRGKKGGKA